MRRTVLSLAALAVLAMAWHLGRVSSETGTAAAEGSDKQAVATAGGQPAVRRLLPRAAAEARAAERPGDALTLLALGRATGDPGWLERALAEHPDDPRVQLERWHAALTPEEKLAAARALKAAAPDNPLGSYLEATLAFERGDLGAVAGLLMDAESAPAYDAYSVEILAETQAAFEGGGWDGYQAWGAALSTRGAEGGGAISVLSRLGDDMGELQHVLVELGHWDEADFMFERTLALGEQLEDSGLLSERLAGQMLQAKLLGSFDPETIVSDDGMRAGQRLGQIRQSQEELRRSYETVDWTNWASKAPAMDAAGWAKFRDILRSDGETAAHRWLSEQK